MFESVIIGCAFGLGAGFVGFLQAWDEAVCGDPDATAIEAQWAEAANSGSVEGEERSA